MVCGVFFDADGLNPKVYVSGGFSKDPSNLADYVYDNKVFDLGAGTWHAAPALPFNPFHSATVLPQGRPFLITGGATLSISYDRTYRFDPDTWEQLLHSKVLPGRSHKHCIVRCNQC